MNDDFSRLSGKVHLHVCTPCYGCKMRKEFLASLLALQALSMNKGIQMSVEFMGNESLIPRGRNILAANFLRGPGTHLLFIDADIVFDPATALRLAALDKDIATALYPKKSIDWDMVKRKRVAGDPEDVRSSGVDLNINLKGGHATVENGFARVLDAATGFMMLSRSALEKLNAAYADTLTCSNDLYPSRLAIPEYVAIFDCMICPETKRYLSEDYAVCRRAQAIGLDIWACVCSGLTHMGTRQARGDIMQRFQLRYVPEAVPVEAVKPAPEPVLVPEIIEVPAVEYSSSR